MRDGRERELAERIKQTTGIEVQSKEFEALGLESEEEIKLIESELILHYKPIKNEVLK